MVNNNISIVCELLSKKNVYLKYKSFFTSYKLNKTIKTVQMSLMFKLGKTYQIYFANITHIKQKKCLLRYFLASGISDMNKKHIL